MKKYFYIIIGSIMILTYFGIVTYNGYKDLGIWMILKIYGGIFGIFLWLGISVFLIIKGFHLKKRKKNG